MKVLHILLLSFLAVGLTCQAQDISGQSYFSIEPYISEDGSYRIPLIKNDNPAAERINQIIQMTTAGKSLKVAGDEIFKDLLDEYSHGVVSLDYNILINTQTLLSICFNDETVAAYPDNHTFHLTFNSATGDIVNLGELFTKSGREHINSLANTEFNDRIEEFFKVISEDSSLTFEEREEIYGYVFDLTNCNANHYISEFNITGEALTLIKGRCFPHVIQAYDIDWSCTIPFDKFYSNDLTGYGRNLLVEKRADTTKHYDLKQDCMNLHGFIDNKYPFTMYLTFNSDNSIDGYYWYNKFGNLIDFKGTRHSRGKIVIKEDSGRFEIDIDQTGSISGTWYDKHGRGHFIRFY